MASLVVVAVAAVSEVVGEVVGEVVAVVREMVAVVDEMVVVVVVAVAVAVVTQGLQLRVVLGPVLLLPQPLLQRAAPPLLLHQQPVALGMRVLRRPASRPHPLHPQSHATRSFALA